MLGLGVRLTASLGVLLMLAFNLAKPQPSRQRRTIRSGVYLFTVRTANWPVTLLLLLLALAAAGRILGLDALAARAWAPLAALDRVGCPPCSSSATSDSRTPVRPSWTTWT